MSETQAERDWEAASSELDRLMGQFAHFESTDVMDYLRLSQPVLRKMCPEECGEVAYLLQQEAVFIQLLLNELKTKMDWAKFRLDKIVAKEVQSYDRYIPLELKRHLIADNNSAAREYQNIFNKAERLFTRMNFIPTQLRASAETMLRYLNTKERQKYGNST